MSKNVPTNWLWRKSVEEKFWSDFNGCSAKRGAKLNPNDECRRNTEIRSSNKTSTDPLSPFWISRFGLPSSLVIRHSDFSPHRRRSPIVDTADCQSALHPVRCPAAAGLQWL